MKVLYLFFFTVLPVSFLFSQNINPNIFEKITGAVKDYKLDTSAAPDDKLTRKIIEFRNLRGGFNINEAIQFKFAEEESKATDASAKAAIQKSKEDFMNGPGKRWLDNAVIWIYRKEFTYQEMKQLVKFYRTTAGQKMGEELPVIIIKSLAAAENIQKMLQKN